MKKITLYFDETNHSRKIGISKSGGKLTYKKEERWYSYLFVGFKNDEIARMIFNKIENKYFPNNTGEIKSKRLCRFQKFNSINKNNLGFYNELIKEMGSEIIHFQYGSINKVSIFFQKIYKNKEIPRMLGEIKFRHLMIGLPKFISGNMELEFFNELSKETTLKKLNKLIIFKMAEKLEILNGKVDCIQMKNAFQQYIACLKFINNNIIDYKLNIDLKFDYMPMRFGLIKYSLETSINPIVFIDQEHATASELLNSYDTRELDSKNEPLIRFCDHVLGLFRRIVILVNKNHLKNEVINNNFQEITEYPDDIINLSKGVIELLSSLRNLFIDNFWTTFNDIYGDEMSILIGFLDAVKNFGGQMNKIHIRNSIGALLQKNYLNL
ncbi:hypothetical protein MYMA111404_02290 [Mycoplasma marinum]|uniref:DUF3800 domain-containing protein n=1 Tax=Mycoplasma marinum TaxID=1937190 RepID=A0A4R0XU57_9MOLU|nr:hypothetical protein [Mycoplasma marinum]TCG11327.1 hypothetical protein C4B24_02130 [Mycoplasma marinum]